jgi:hypothetical protein
MPDTGHFQIERAFRLMGFISLAENHHDSLVRSSSESYAPHRSKTVVFDHLGGLHLSDCGDQKSSYLSNKLRGK